MRRVVWGAVMMMAVLTLISCTSLHLGQDERTTDKPKLSIMANLHVPEEPPSDIQRLLEEWTGHDLHIQWVPDDAYEDKLRTSLATGTLPQAVFLKNQSSFAMFKDSIRSGQFWEIGPYLSQFPHLSKLEQEVLDHTAVDGKIYSLYQGRSLSRQGVIYRLDWAERLGIAPPQTIDDLQMMMRRFTEEDPDGNGISDTVGLADRNDLVYGAFKTVASYYGTPNNWGIKDGELLPEFMFPGYRQTMDFFRNLYESGWVNRDFAVTSKTKQRHLFQNGKAGMYIGAMADVQTMYYEMVQSEPDVQLDVVNNIADPEGVHHGMWAIPGYGSLVLFPKHAIADEAALLEVLDFFDQLHQPKVANLIFWGVEDQHYAITNQGYADPSIADPGLVERMIKPYQALEIGDPATNGRLEGVYLYLPRQKAERLTRENEEMMIKDPTAVLDSSTYNVQGRVLQEQINDATILYILGELNEEGFEESVQKWLQDGGQQIINEFNASWQRHERPD